MGTGTVPPRATSTKNRMVQAMRFLATYASVAGIEPRAPCLSKSEAIG